jgi:hypothetical protein
MSRKTCSRFPAVLVRILNSALIVAGTGCNQSSPVDPNAPTTASSQSPLSAASETPTPYPEAAWRRAPREVLDRTVLWVSHLLIRHERVQSNEVPFTLTDWYSPEPPATRSRAEALALAQKLAQTARAQNNFRELATRYSEDPVTRTGGGSLGGVVATHLSGWPEVLDAISTLRPGDVSDVVATEYGFHVLARQTPPPERSLSGAHIVIAYADAPWIEMTARRRPARRTRAEAFELAARIAERARARPDEFARLAAEHSDHADAVRGGDLGTWSIREPSGYPREIEVLSQLEIAEISEPIDTQFGVQLLQRTHNVPRERYAATQIHLGFMRKRPDADPASKAAMLKHANEIAAAITRDGARFLDFQRKLCCPDVVEMIQGRELPQLELALAKLSPGQVAARPIETATEFLIPRRLGPDVLPARAPTMFELPHE